MSDSVNTTRPDAEAYARYLAGMDASMRQKVALTAAHLLARGRVADMGTGSGAGAFALAALYPALEVVGVDLDPTIVALARATHTRPNLRFTTGDIAAPVFDDASLNAILNSSVLHHVTSFGGYAHDAAGRALAVQARALAPHGTLIVRDFLAPEDSAAPVYLDLPADDGDDADDPRTASSAALLRRFARELRSLAPSPGFPLAQDEAAPRPGWRRFHLSARHAVEYVLRKDYRRDWESEVREEYTYYTQAQFEAVFAGLGLRVLASTPLYNPWIIRNRFEGRFALFDAATGRPRAFPPTNYVIVGEKVPFTEGVRFRDAGDVPPIGYLHFECHRDDETGQIRDLVSRPNPTLDALPWFRQDGDLFVLARTSYPRPLLSSRAALAPSPCGTRAPHYLAEPLSVVLADGSPEAHLRTALADAGLLAARILSVDPGAPHYPSPGGTLEEVRPYFARIEPTLDATPAAPSSGFSTSGQLRAIEARQLLRAAAVGGLPDPRLELHTYALLRREGQDPGPWIGEALTPSDHAEPPPAHLTTECSSLWSAPPRRRFTPVAVEHSRGFLERRAAAFEELDAHDRTLHTQVREGVLPRTLSLYTVAAAPLWRCGADYYVGLDDDDLPAAQRFSGDSRLPVAPAWRLPEGTWNRETLRAFVSARLRDEYGVTVGATFDLGGRYHPSAGLSPEVVYPLALDVIALDAGSRPLRFVSLRALAADSDALRDGHLRTVTLRAAHALGLL